MKSFLGFYAPNLEYKCVATPLCQPGNETGLAQVESILKLNNAVPDGCYQESTCTVPLTWRPPRPNMTVGRPSYLGFYAPNSQYQCVETPLCQAGNEDVMAQFESVLRSNRMIPNGCYLDPDCRVRSVPTGSNTILLPPDYSASGNACPIQEQAKCIGFYHYDWDKLIPAGASPCVPTRTGSGFGNDECYVGFSDPCHLTGPNRPNSCPRSCMANCCPGNKPGGVNSEPEPVPTCLPTAGYPCTYKRPCYQQKTGDIRYECEACQKSNSFTTAADAYDFSHRLPFPQTQLSPCSPFARSFYPHY